MSGKAGGGGGSPGARRRTCWVREGTRGGWAAVLSSQHGHLCSEAGLRVR